MHQLVLVAMSCFLVMSLKLERVIGWVLMTVMQEREQREVSEVRDWNLKGIVSPFFVINYGLSDC